MNKALTQSPRNSGSNGGAGGVPSGVSPTAAAGRVVDVAMLSCAEGRVAAGGAAGGARLPTSRDFRIRIGQAQLIG